MERGRGREKEGGEREREGFRRGKRGEEREREGGERAYLVNSASQNPNPNYQSGLEMSARASMALIESDNFLRCCSRTMALVNIEDGRESVEEGERENRKAFYKLTSPNG